MNERELFQQLLDIADAAERSNFLDGIEPPELRQRLSDLLIAHQRGTNFLEEPHPAAAAIPTLDETQSAALTHEGAGTVIASKYKLLQQIGEGGMGTVWMADQTEPVKRRVAVKLIRVDKGHSKTILARFEAERQAIALMDHPHIAKLLDAGTTESGSPFFVLELVKGIPLTDYCDEHKLSIPDRLKLFIQICGAVQHAHQKGIIHRDLKPSNILVESHDGKPVPKVIDFGLAKATTGLKLTEKSLFTGFGSVMGTPIYMAPEQANFSAIDIDTRADIYALGAVLYELLTGTTPLTRDTIKKAQLDELLKLIREQEPPTPSSRLSSVDSAPSVAANRQIEPTKLSRFMRGELDWITLKALSKERDRRYETANGFAKDIERFLNHEPVQAGPPSTTYKLKKFVRRNRGTVVATSAIGIALLAGVIGTTWGLIEARKQTAIAQAETTAKDEALVAEKSAKEQVVMERNAAELSRQAEERERKFAQAIADFVRNDFLALTSVEGQHRFSRDEGAVGLSKDTTLRELLDRAAEKLKQRHDLDPQIEAELNWIIGVSYRDGGDATQAIPFLERTVEIRKDMLGEDHERTLDAQNSLAVALGDAGKNDLALPLLEVTLERTKAKFGNDHPDTLSSMNNLASGYDEVGKLDLALPLHKETLKRRRAKLGNDHPSTLESMSNLATHYKVSGKVDLALSLYEETLKLTKARLGDNHPATLTSMSNLALGYGDAGKFDLALPLLEETLRLRKAILGNDHPSTLISMNNLAWGYKVTGKLDLALPLNEDTLKLMKVKLGNEHPDTLTSMGNLATSYQAAGKLDIALPLLEETVKLSKSKLGNNHPGTLVSMGNLAMGYKAAGKHNLALPLFEETLKLRKEKLGDDHPDTLSSMNNLALGYQAADKLDLALPLFEETLERTKEKLGDDHPATLDCMSNLAMGYYSVEKHDLALPLFEETLTLTKEKLGDDHPDTLTSMNNLAWGYYVVGKLDLTVQLFEETLERRKEKFGNDHPDTVLSMGYLALVYGAVDRRSEAIDMYEQAAKGIENNHYRHSHTDKILPATIYVYEAAQQFDRAESWRRKWLTVVKERSGGESLDYAGELAALSLNLFQQQKWSDAETTLRECLTIREKIQPDAWTTFNTQSMLGETLLGQKKYAEAEPLLIQGYEGMKARETSIPTFASTGLPEAIERLILLYTETDQPDELKKWQDERAKATGR